MPAGEGPDFRGGAGSYQRTVDVESLADRRPVSVKLDNGDEVCLVRVDGQVLAVPDRCTHADYPLSDGEVGSGCEIECALHGAVFDLRDGRVLEGPAVEPLQCLRVEIRDGAVWIGVGDDGS